MTESRTETRTTGTRTLADALDGMRFAMVATADGPEWKARPLTVAEQDGATLRFLVSSTAEWVVALERTSSRTGVTFADPDKNTYVALQGTARTTHDRALITRLWNPAAAAYFEGRDDPTLRVLEVHVEAGEWWDGPSGHVGQMIAIVKAALGGQPGAQGTVAT